MNPSPGEAAPGTLADSLRRRWLCDSIELAEEVARRKARRRCLVDQRFIAELLYPPEDPSNSGFWVRFSEATQWVLDLQVIWKSRGSILVPARFSVSRGSQGRMEVLERDTLIDLTEFTLLLIMQSRETLKTACARIDLVHDLMFWPFVRGVHCATAWFSHKVEAAVEFGSQPSKGAMCASDRFFDVWGGILVPQHRNPDNWGSDTTWNTPIHPRGAPENATQFLAVKTRYEGGRYKSGRFDDLVTGEDRDSPPKREATKQNIKDRESERDKVHGLRIFNGTDWHPQDAYQQLKAQRGALCVRLPCITGSVKKFWEFANLEPDERKRCADQYARVCKPVYPHLGMMQLGESFDGQQRITFASQMLLAPQEGGRKVFDVANIVKTKTADVPKGLPGFVFCDPAFKKQENKFSGDYNAIGVIVWDQFGRRIVLDGSYRQDWGVFDAFEHIVELSIRYPNLLGAYCEDRVAMDLNDTWRLFSREHPCRWGALLALERAGSDNKMAAIKALEPEFRAGHLVICEDTEIGRAILDEADKYDVINGPAEHDDALDMIRQSYDPAVGIPLFRRSRDAAGPLPGMQHKTLQVNLRLPGHGGRR